MSVYSTIFYLLAALIVAATALAITRRNLVHAVIYLVISFFGTAMLFYLFGAPFLAALEIIIYAGAIMILFLFIVMMINVDVGKEHFFPLSQWVPAAVMGVIYLVMGAILVFTAPDTDIHLASAVAGPTAFGQYVFERHWLSVEIVSLLLLIALIGAFVLGRDIRKKKMRPEDKP